MRHEGFSFYGPKKSDEGADTGLIYNFCWLNGVYGLNIIDEKSETTVLFCVIGRTVLYITESHSSILDRFCL